MNDETIQVCTWDSGSCTQERVSGSEYCEDHLLQSQVQALRPAPMGTLASLIRQAKGAGLLKPVSEYAGT